MKVLSYVHCDCHRPRYPANILSFSLISAPGGASINPANGVFSWTATEAQGPSTNTFWCQSDRNQRPSGKTS